MAVPKIANIYNLYVSFCSGYNGTTVLVRLRAVAMERDDNSDGWVPIGAGGLSNVCVVRRSIPISILPTVPDAPAATSTISLPGAPSNMCQDLRTGAAVTVTTAAASNNSSNLNSRNEFVIYANRMIDNEVFIYGYFERKNNKQAIIVELPQNNSVSKDKYLQH